MKKTSNMFNFLLLPIDGLMIIIGFTLAYYIRSQSEIIYVWQFSDYSRFFLIALPIWIVIFTLEGLYNIRNPKRGFSEFYSITVGVSAGIMLIVAWLFLSRTTFFSRLVIIYAWVFNIVLILFGRWALRLIQILLYQHGIGTKGLLIIGNNNIAQDLIKIIQTDKNLGYSFTGIATTPNDKIAKDKQLNIKILGEMEQISEIYQKHPFDEMVLADPLISERHVTKLMEFSEKKKIVFKEIPNLFKVRTSNAINEVIGGIPILEFRKTPLEGWGQVEKRMFDIISSLVLLILFSPLIFLIAIAIKLESKGSVIYKNKRMGADGKEFYVYKFRYMKIQYCTGEIYGGKKALELEKKLINSQSVRQGPLYKIADDPRKTKVGTFIEKYKLDEIPQLFNVLMGNMSLVGPRPHQPREVKKYKKHHFKVFRIKPGLTGMAQISGSSDLDFEDEVKLDTYYIENWSLWLDLKIFFKTPYEMFRIKRNIIT